MIMVTVLERAAIPVQRKTKMAHKPPNDGSVTLHLTLLHRLGQYQLQSYYGPRYEV